ncbi:MAG: YihA family ribosome biogenesis GTP-binding protein [Selenomonadaceae bacterium]|nr:YihA family ribosome biogenesis GTP-binding protein [Selenomonadaceae bacterium]
MEIKIIKSDYVTSAVRSSQYPEEILPEIVFIGRSNVGKSSLINSLTNRKNLARTSQTPGKTQTINFYKATLKITEPPELKNFYLVDLPGYGYAKTSKTNRGIWAKFIDEYLSKSLQIKFVCQLVDIRHAPQDSDLQTFKNILEKNLPVLIVATKSDKLSKNERAKNLAVIKKSFGIEELPILPYSSKNGEGNSDLLDVIADSL